MHEALPQSGKGSLLVVDDDLNTRQTLNTLLSGKGYAIRCAADGKTALMFAEADPPELILLDVRLPDLDGFEVCRRLKSSDKISRVPVIFLSGLDNPKDKIEGFEAGGVDYITKPFQVEEVLARVETHLALHRLQTQVETQNVTLDSMIQERTSELLSEIQRREQAEISLQERLLFEQLLSGLSARFVNLSSDRVDEEIQDALTEVREFFQVDRCALLQVLSEEPLWEITHVAAAEDAPPVPVGSRLDVVTTNPWAYNKLIRNRESLNVSSLDDLPAEANVDRQTWIEWGIRSNLNVPIMIGEPIVYVMAVNSIKSERVWPDELIPRLQLLGEIFVNALARKDAELFLRESEERLSLTVDAVGAGLWVMEVDSGHVWVTEKTRELFHFTPDEELNYESFFKVIHPEDRERVNQDVQQAIQSGESLLCDYRIILPDGSIRWIVARGQRHLRTTGEPDRILGLSLDITERKEMETRLLEQLAEIEKLKHQLEAENVYLREEIKVGQGFEKIVGNSDALQYVLFRAAQVASTDATVLILGETGTGKGMVAHAIHEISTRKDKPMITVDCASLPANLIESELFGREKGAFTGAHAKQIGRFEVANGGTIFLDEIGEMPLELQAKLLRVLQDGEFERLGSPRTIKVDVRVIAATGRDLKVDMQNGRFREDLFYRLNVFPVSLPPLRMRVDDIPQLVNYFVDRYAGKFGRQFKTIPKSTMKSLQEYHWPGNVRELEHVIERAVITSTGPVFQLADLLECKAAAAGEEPLKSFEEIEREHILKVLDKTSWKIEGVGGAAAILGLNPSTLRFRIKKLDIQRP